MCLTVIFILIAAHCFGDYPMQGEFLASNKGKNNIILLVHCIIYTACIMIGFYIALPIINIHPNLTIMNVIMIGTLVSHFIIDKNKCDYIASLEKDYNKLEEEKEILIVRSFYADQLYHMAILVLLLTFAIAYHREAFYIF